MWVRGELLAVNTALVMWPIFIFKSRNIVSYINATLVTIEQRTFQNMLSVSFGAQYFLLQLANEVAAS